MNDEDDARRLGEPGIRRSVFEHLDRELLGRINARLPALIDEANLDIQKLNSRMADRIKAISSESNVVETTRGQIAAYEKWCAEKLDQARTEFADKLKREADRVLSVALNAHVDRFNALVEKEWSSMVTRECSKQISRLMRAPRKGSK